MILEDLIEGEYTVNRDTIIDVSFDLDSINCAFVDNVVEQQVYSHAENKHDKSEKNSSWFIRFCFNFAKSSNVAFSGVQLAEQILLLYNKHKNSLQEFESKLFELVGENGFEFMFTILQNTNFLSNLSISDINNFVINESNIKVFNDKNETKLNLPAIEINQPDWLRVLGFDENYLSQERTLGLQKSTRTEVGSIMESLSIYGGLEFHEKVGLPTGAVKVSGLGFEEVHIPAISKYSIKSNDLILISSLESWAQLAFENTTRLNAIQSAVFNTAYNTSENMLICAPTGAGKTNIAMLTFLQSLKQNISNGILVKSNVKAIYIAPMKALAQEVVVKFGERLSPLGLVVKEYTGDMQLTKYEVAESHLLVTTPEKYDVITRKGGDGSLGTLVNLIIIDEVHLLADDRGAVIETIVSRTQRFVESSQKLVRLVGLSATLPNYKDVALFLGVNPRTGLYYFGPEFRPVPLEQTFIGVTEKNRIKRIESMNKLAFDKLVKALERDKQVMIFVHSRKETSKTAEAILELAQRNFRTSLFENIHNEKFSIWKKEVDKSRNREVQQYFYQGVGIHHAGMLRSDRTMTERMFECGLLRVLCCTATLAWGVNLPAHTVIIKGTELYDPERGGFVDLSILDVFQIFGRAGRPQYDNTGHAILITPHKTLGKYLSLLGQQSPIESGLIKSLPDHMNAEIVNGTINNVKEAVQWLSYTFLYIRMCKNPTAYGISLDERMNDTRLEFKRLQLVREAAEKLDQCRMIRYDQRSGNLAVTDLGRIASHYYLKYSTIDSFNTLLQPHLNDADALRVLCSSSEFDQLKVRPEEISEIETLKLDANITFGGSADDTVGKVNILLQSYLNNRRINSFTLQSDTNYIAQNAGRVTRALFEISLRRGWSTMASYYLNLSKSIDKRMELNHSPFRQFDDLPPDIIKKLEEVDVTLDQILDMSAREIGELIRNQKFGSKILSLAKKIPKITINAQVQPLTRGILRISISLIASFEWSDRYHGTSEQFWVWIEDGENEYIYHSENIVLHKKSYLDEHNLEFTIPVREPLPPQYYIKVMSDRWLGSQAILPVSFKHLLLPDKMPPHTNLLNIHPVPKQALNNSTFESIYKFSYFNPIQSQLFHSLYHTDVNILVGAPTGSGKTIIGEIALLRLFSQRKGAKAIYVAPLKALARERLIDWQKKLTVSIGLKVQELTGDITPDIAALKSADLLIVTPEKWDSISRGWEKREYVQLVELVIIDEIHLLGVDRGPVLEVIVSRMRFIATQTKKPIRFVGLSTALANPRDLADWLGIDKVGVYNFRPSVRPIPMTIHIMGFPGKHYCPRMATMNKPCYAAIREHSPNKPVLIFVSSRRQTRLTALDIISYCASDDNPKQFLNMPEDDILSIASTISDNSLKDTIIFGIGIHHAGLNNHDRSIVEELFLTSKIQVLVCTSTLAWGVNLPCHLVIVKGTEYYDGKTKKYVDMPVTDVLQMMGRAGRPQFDDTGVACIFVYEPKKNFYRKFLHEPFPVESSLHKQLHDHINAEIASETLKYKKDCFEYISWTYFFRRLIMNPSYYQLSDITPEGLEQYLNDLITAILSDLVNKNCVLLDSIPQDKNPKVLPTNIGKIVSYYYIHYETGFMYDNSVKYFRNNCNIDINNINDQNISDFVQVICSSIEYSELPVRHNEEILNEKLANDLPWKVIDTSTFDKPSTKAFLLLQAYFYHVKLPISDYNNDLKSILDQLPRLLNAIIDISINNKYLNETLLYMKIVQMVSQGRYYLKDLDLFKQINYDIDVSKFKKYKLHNFIDLLNLSKDNLRHLSLELFQNNSVLINDFIYFINSLPLFKIKTEVIDKNNSNEIIIKVTRIHGFDVNDRSNKFYNQLSKVKSYSWWLVLGYSYKEILTFKRISFIGNSIDISFIIDKAYDCNNMTVYMICDSFMGLDIIQSIQ